MNKFSQAMSKVGTFIKRNAFYLLIIVCIASIATIVALAVTREDASLNVENNVSQQPDTPVVNPDDDNTPNDTLPNKPVDNQDETLTFLSPCNNPTIIKDYNDSQLVWNATLNQYATHVGVDFTSSDLNVYASAKGTVKEVGHNNLDGHYIVLVHDNGYVTKYYSLEDTGDLKVGSVINQGALIGKMSTSQGSESLDGAHLHFEMWRDGEAINPLEVIVLDNK